MRKFDRNKAKKDESSFWSKNRLMLSLSLVMTIATLVMIIDYGPDRTLYVRGAHIPWPISFGLLAMAAIFAVLSIYSTIKDIKRS